MKALLAIICTFSALSAFSAQDYTTWEGKYGTKYVSIEGLQEDLFQMYKIKDSRGPKWGQDIDFMADIVDEDFYERHTYWSESGYPYESCPEFTESDFENAYEEGYGLNWSSVKKLKGSKKTVYYLARYTITIYANGKSCTYEQSPSEQYVFINKLVNGKPTYLGYLSE